MFILCDDDQLLKTHAFIYLLKFSILTLHIQINFKKFHTLFFCFVVDFLI